MRILVAVKAVPDPSGVGRAARVGADGRTIEFSHGHAWILNGYDKNAVELALVLRDQGAGSVTALRGQRIEVRVARVEMVSAPDAAQAGARLAEILDAAGLVT